MTASWQLINPHVSADLTEQGKAQDLTALTEPCLPQTAACPLLQVVELMELGPLAGALVGSPGQSGLSVEQRKRLTIGVELCANPSVIFMDEPTSGTGFPVTIPLGFWRLAYTLSQWPAICRFDHIGVYHMYFFPWYWWSGSI